MLFRSDAFINLESLSEKQFYASPDGKVTGFSRSLDGKELAKAEKLTILQLPDSTRQQYAGTYTAEDGNNGEVIVKDNILWLKVEGEQKKVYFISTTQFYTAEDDGVDYSVNIGKDGKVTGISGKQGEQDIVYKKTK